MINYKELRIGNLVGGTKDFSKYPMPMKITAIINDKVYATNIEDRTEFEYDGFFSPNHSDGEIHGIPLSYEMFSKCGFKDDYRHEYANGISNGDIYITEIDSDLVCEIGNGGLILHPELEYLHQLQNLIFSLTGKELEIKL